MRQMRYTDKELGIIKNTFADNDDALIALRKKMLGYPMTEVETNLTNFKGELKSVMVKTFNPQIDPDAPINQVIDLWMIVDFRDKTPEQARLLFRAKKKQLDFIDDKLNGKNKISFDEFTYSDDGEDDEVLVNQITRNNIVLHIEQQLNQLKFLAGQKDETVDETKKRLEADSAK